MGMEGAVSTPAPDYSCHPMRKRPGRHCEKAHSPLVAPCSSPGGPLLVTGLGRQGEGRGRGSSGLGMVSATQ